MHAFVTSRIDYCNVVFVGAPKFVTNKLQRVVSGTRKFDHGLTQLLHADLHWLDVPERVRYKLCMMMRRCQDGTPPQYLAVHWAPVSETASWRHLRSAASHQLTVPLHRRITYGGRAFAVAGPSTWNSLPQCLRDPSHSTAFLAVFSKHSFSQSTSVSSTLEALAMTRYINLRFTLHYNYQ